MHHIYSDTVVQHFIHTKYTACRTYGLKLHIIYMIINIQITNHDSSGTDLVHIRTCKDICTPHHYN